ncbi:LptM family lipoprotein [Zongyangia hominis]|uniref:DUF3828 domain-containing protein n=1 Tax=Zongyangia hominis TaxID=2763677 RepID=A0A926EA46_9FIRM|nr:hypothetical protein [Zongyangia hominis]MBC8570127.1 hypothetical protein [Zongyangia hominis]
MKRWIAGLLAAFMLCSLAGCGEKVEKGDLPSDGKKATIEQVKDYLDAMIPKAVEVIGIFSVDGLPVDPGAADAATEDENGQIFVPVQSDTYHSVQDIKDAAEQVFTVDYLQQAYYQYVFDGTYARFKDVDGVLYEDVNQGGGGSNDWLTDTAEIVSQEADSIVVNITHADGYGGKNPCRMTLSATEDGWRIGNVEFLD